MREILTAENAWSKH